MKALALKQKFFLRTLGMLMLCVIVPLCAFCGAAFLIQHNFILPVQKQNSLLLADQAMTSFDNDVEEFEMFVLSSMVSGRVPITVKQLLNSISFGYEDLILFNNMKEQISNIKNNTMYVQEIAVWFENDQKTYLSDSGKQELPQSCLWLDSFAEHSKDYSWWTIVGKSKRFDGQDLKVIYLCHLLGSSGMIAIACDPVLLEQALVANFPQEGESLQVYSEDGILLTGSPSPIDGEHFLTFESISSQTGWHAVLAVPKSHVFASSRQFLYLMIAFIGSAMIISLILAFVFARKRTSQVAILLDMIHAAEYGKPLPSVSNLQKETTTYAYISQRLLSSFLETKYLKTQLEAKKLKLTNAELMALQAQLNPHFLYNTLETLNWKCYQLTGGQNEATYIIEELSDILHYALGREGMFVTLDEELEYIKSYLEIMQLRYKDLFVVRMEIADETKAWKVPRMILQPLVENAISHGLKKAERSGSLVIKSSIANSDLCVEVSDDGVGIPYERLEEIKASLNTDELQSDRIGLSNVDLRLFVLYGKHLELLSEEGKGTTVRLLIREKECMDV
jgi:Predicted signal transduction protein with a C-terminal ATPase domain